MKVRSTGLGRTLMEADLLTIRPSKLKPETLQITDEPEPTRLLIQMGVTSPVHWDISIFAEPQDMRKIILRILFKPSVWWYALTSILHIRR